MSSNFSSPQNTIAVSSALPPRKALLFWLLATLFAVFVYFYGLGSDHTATNGDELLYAQIARATALSGHWLPLQSPIARHANTKPPLLFWQGMISTDFVKSWSLFNLRYPNVLYTLATALMLVFLGKRLSGKLQTGLLAGLLFLSFFGTFRYGRCFLTSAPEVFWLFAPFFLLLQWPRLFHSWAIVPLLGVIIGIGLLYKSFALLVPVAVGLSWWYLQTRNYAYRTWFVRDLGKMALLSLIALGIFGLWFLGDPHPQAIFHDFIVRENCGKFDAGGVGGYLFNFFFGGSSIWRNVIAYPLNAGLLMPAVIFLLLTELISFFKISIPNSRFSPFFKKEASMGNPDEIYLWNWLVAVFVIFSFPNQRDERYLLLAMPALALLLALHWEAIPRWILALTLVAVAVVTAGLAGLALLLEHHLASAVWNFYHYPAFYWLLLGSVLGFALFGIRAPQWTGLFVCPGVLLLYLCYGAFLAPFDGPLGHFDTTAQAAIDHQEVWVPINFNAREESYRFLLPETLEVLPYDYKPTITIAQMQAKAPYFIVSLPLTDHSEETAQGAQLLGRRLNLIDRFNAQETQAILMGNIAPYLFHQDLLFKKAAL
ncbi:MAG: phospholipid carrier-dependent glycosyltransferase [Chthoniobacterales bacterium]|nr:phospholipid carrier-dependent glycosyltransferase [Chthoniobacterales bacterium]